MEPLAPGNVVASRYRLERLLGEGGMGQVFEATHLHLAQRVAIKVLRPELSSSPDAVARFVREARAAVKIESEHVARVMDVGTTEAGLPYMVMEYLEGFDLASTLEREERLPLSRAVAFLLQAADAVAEAHTLGIVHRDLKPSNLFLAARRDGSMLLKVLDFGISKAATDLLGGPISAQTATAMVMGSPLYMAPEQVRSSKNVDSRADIWSLGVILHEMLAGEPPFRAESLSGVLASIVADPPSSVRERRPDLPLSIETVILRCLEKDREARFESVAALCSALRAFAPPESDAVLARIALLGGWAGPTLPPLRKSVHPPAESGVAPNDSNDTHRGWARALGPIRESTVGFALVGALALAAAGFAYLAARPSLAEAPNAQNAQNEKPSTNSSPAAPPILKPADTSQAPLSPARWEELETGIAGETPPIVAPANALLDERLFADRK